MSKGDWPRPVNKKKFDEEFDRIFKKKKKQSGESRVLFGDSKGQYPIYIHIYRASCFRQLRSIIFYVVVSRGDRE